MTSRSLLRIPLNQSNQMTWTKEGEEDVVWVRGSTESGWDDHQQALGHQSFETTTNINTSTQNMTRNLLGATSPTSDTSDSPLHGFEMQQLASTEPTRL